MPASDDAVQALMDRYRFATTHIQCARSAGWRRVDVSDVIQDVLREANRRPCDYLAEPKMRISILIRQIMKDRIIDAHRRHRVSAKRKYHDREQPLLAPGNNDQSTMELAGQLCDPSMLPAVAATRKERRAADRQLSSVTG
ncbi:MAG: hypothetical protein U0905_16845 [Pirellulales bacterium]